MHTVNDLKRIGGLMSRWHSSGDDPIYAVGSFFVGGKEYPNVDVVKSAITNLGRDLSIAKKLFNGWGWGPTEVRELTTIIAFLKKYVTEKTKLSKHAKHPGLDEMFDAYVTAALWWSSTDESNERGGESIDQNYGPSDLTKEAAGKMLRDVARFLNENDADIGGNYSQAGRDLWSTRNHYGVGFLDRPKIYGKDAANRLTQAAHKLRKSDIIVDRGRLHVEP